MVAVTGMDRLPAFLPDLDSAVTVNVPAFLAVAAFDTLYTNLPEVSLAPFLAGASVVGVSVAGSSVVGVSVVGSSVVGFLYTS